MYFETLKEKLSRLLPGETLPFNEVIECAKFIHKTGLEGQEYEAMLIWDLVSRSGKETIYALHPLVEKLTVCLTIGGDEVKNIPSTWNEYVLKFIKHKDFQERIINKFGYFVTESGEIEKRK